MSDTRGVLVIHRGCTKERYVARERTVTWKGGEGNIGGRACKKRGEEDDGLGHVGGGGNGVTTRQVNGKTLWEKGKAVGREGAHITLEEKKYDGVGLRGLRGMACLFFLWGVWSGCDAMQCVGRYILFSCR